MGYFIARVQDDYAILKDETGKKKAKEYWDEYDEVYPIERPFYHMYTLYQKEGKDIDYFLKALYQSYHFELYYNKDYDKRGEERIKVLSEYSGENIEKIVQMQWVKEELFIGKENEEAEFYKVIHKDELKIIEAKSLLQFFDSQTTLEIGEKEVKTLLGLTDKQLEYVWRKGQLFLYELSDKQQQTLLNYIKSQKDYTAEKMISWDTNGFYETVGDYYIFPDEQTLKYRLKEMMKK